MRRRLLTQPSGKLNSNPSLNSAPCARKASPRTTFTPHAGKHARTLQWRAPLSSSVQNSLRVIFQGSTLASMSLGELCTSDKPQTTTGVYNTAEKCIPPQSQTTHHQQITNHHNINFHVPPYLKEGGTRKTQQITKPFHEAFHTTTDATAAAAKTPASVW